MTIDPSGQLFMTCAPELMQRGFRVIPIMPFSSGFPAGVAALVKQTRCLNPVNDLLFGESFDADRAELGTLLKPDQKVETGDPFWPLTGRALIRLGIGCVKLYSHPSEQNLPEVYHKIGNIFADGQAGHAAHHLHAVAAAGCAGSRIR